MGCLCGLIYLHVFFIMDIKLFRNKIPNEPRTGNWILCIGPLRYRRRKSQLISWRQGEDLLKQLEFLLFKLEVRTAKFLRNVRKSQTTGHGGYDPKVKHGETNEPIITVITHPNVGHCWSRRLNVAGLQNA